MDASRSLPLSFEARSDPNVNDSMSTRCKRLADTSVPVLNAMGWDDREAAALLLAA